MRKSKIILFMGISLLVIVTATFFYNPKIFGLLNNDNKVADVVNINYDWEHYATVAELIDKSDLIIIGKVLDANKIKKNQLPLILNQDLSVENKKKYQENINPFEIVTASKIQINKILKGSKDINSIINIEQVGGNYEGVSYNVEGINYLKVGDEAIYFLVKTSNDNVFVPINDTQSHNYIINGKVKPNKNEQLFSEEKTTEDFIKEISKNI